VNVSHKFLEIRIFVADYRLISVLEEVPVPLVPPVEGNRVACEKPPHECGQTGRAASEEKVNMIREQRPAVDARLCVRRRISEAHHEGLTILVITNNEASLYPAHDDVMEGAGRIQARTSGHDEAPSFCRFVRR
jgi:hypothetical protein